MNPVSLVTPSAWTSGTTCSIDCPAASAVRSWVWVRVTVTLPRTGGATWTSQTVVPFALETFRSLVGR